VTWIVLGLYGFLLLVALLNAALMVRPQRDSGDPNFCVLIPARNEADNLRNLLPGLNGVKVYVFDDESEDQTAEVAQELGATVIRGEPLPKGWTGKNRACHELAKVAAEDSPAEWLLFLDADMRVKSEFIPRVQGAISGVGRRVPVISGFPTMLPGKGVEPIYTSWVPWILLATNPYGLVSATRCGHNRFTNGQITLWRASTYWEIRPNETLKSRILEDVLIGRLLAKQGVRVEVVDFSKVLATRMYANLGKAIDGMSKNSYEITGNLIGTIGMSLMLLLTGWGWALCGALWWPALGLLLVGKFVTDRLTRAPIWLFPFMPITCTMAAVTFIRSAIWHRKGVVQWKGRTYPGL
jgi:glycosyltransferase involved in cell wall biosynthesis